MAISELNSAREHITGINTTNQSGALYPCILKGILPNRICVACQGRFLTHQSTRFRSSITEFNAHLVPPSARRGHSVVLQGFVRQLILRATASGIKIATMPKLAVFARSPSSCSFSVRPPCPQTVFCASSITIESKTSAALSLSSEEKTMVIFSPASELVP